MRYPTLHNFDPEQFREEADFEENMKRLAREERYARWLSILTLGITTALMVLLWIYKK